MAKETPELLNNVIEEMDILATQDFLDPRGAYSECIWHPRQIAKWLRELKELRGIKKPHMVNNRPLTPYELMGMDGQEVWVKLRRPIGTFPMLSRCFVDVLNMRMMEDAEMPSKYYGFNYKGGYWEQWVAYRNKPEDCDDREDH